MESCGSSKREVEKPKSFHDRALQLDDRLCQQRDAIVTMNGHRDSPLTLVLADAIELLAEARRRGVKGREPVPVDSLGNIYRVRK